MPIALHEDKKGYYYQFGDTGAKYYFNSVSGETRAYNKVLKQSRAIEWSKHHQGGIIIDEELGGKLFPEIRRDFPPYVRQLIAEFEDFEIKNITVCRNPIQRSLTGLLNLFSLGQIEKQMKRLGYDRLFHLFMLINLSNGRVLLLEKNEVINMYVVTKNINIDSFQKVNVNKNIKLKDFINNTVKAVGPSIYLYNAETNNCQDFIINLLKSNGLLTEQLNKFIKQDTKSLLSTSPIWVKKISNLTTDFASWFNRIRYGKGKLLITN